MKTIFTILLFLGAFFSVNAQSANCAYVCHQGQVVKALNANAVQGHINHGDVYLGSCEEYSYEVGSDCNNLSVPEFAINSMPLGESYELFDIQGKLLEKGILTETTFREFPRYKVLILRVKGYKAKMIVR